MLIVWSESSKSVSIRGLDLVHVPPHLLPIVRVLGPVPLVVDLGDQGRDQVAPQDEGPVHGLEPGVSLDLLGPPAPSSQSSGGVPPQEAATGTLRTLLTFCRREERSVSNIPLLIDLFPKWYKTWQSPIIW